MTIMEGAIGMVSDGHSIRETAYTLGISKSTLQQSFKKHNGEVIHEFIPLFTPNYCNKIHKFLARTVIRLNAV